MTPITQELLLDAGFDKVHINPNYRGGFFRYYLYGTSKNAEIAISFGEGIKENNEGYAVWLYSGNTATLLPYITTMEQLSNLAIMLFGTAISEYTGAEKKSEINEDELASRFYLRDDEIVIADHEGEPVVIATVVGEYRRQVRELLRIAQFAGEIERRMDYFIKDTATRGVIPCPMWRSAAD